MIGHVWNQISDSWVSVYSGNVDSDFITVANTLPVTVKIHFWMLAKKFYLLYWVLKKKKNTKWEMNFHISGQNFWVNLQ